MTQLDEGFLLRGMATAFIHKSGRWNFGMHLHGFSGTWAVDHPARKRLGGNFAAS